MVGVEDQRRCANLENGDAIVGLGRQLRELLFGLPDQFLRESMPIRYVYWGCHGAMETVELPILHARHFKRAARRGQTG